MDSAAQPTTKLSPRVGSLGAALGDLRESAFLKGTWPSCSSPCNSRTSAVERALSHFVREPMVDKHSKSELWDCLRIFLKGCNPYSKNDVIHTHELHSSSIDRLPDTQFFSIKRHPHSTTCITNSHLQVKARLEFRTWLCWICDRPQLESENETLLPLETVYIHHWGLTQAAGRRERQALNHAHRLH
eukprot:3045089-Amphidinium_carterae.1